LPLREPLLRAIQAALSAHARRTVEVPERRQAAVMIMLFERGGEPWVVLTKRTETVSTHKGQISFPGGARDATDADLWTTAVRETEEEMGVAAASLQQIGALDDYPTFATGFIVSPFVAAIEPGEWNPSPHEIAEVIEVPLRALAEVGRMEVWEHDGVKFPMHIFDVDGHRVWGVTAFILRRFLDIVRSALAEHPTEQSNREPRPDGGRLRI
jgi:8-oxo-dGTP pyrophosphatase MutT (NUDIX family)